MKVPDERIIAALLEGCTNAAAAQAVGLSLTQLYARMRAAGFKEKLREARAQFLDSAVTALQSKMSAAVGVTAEIMTDCEAPAQVRLNAAEMIMRNSLRLSERLDISGRLDALEETLEGLEDERQN